MPPKAKRPEVPVPPNMQNLPLTDGGYLKPWFVKEDDFRVVDGDKARLSVMKKACWICGKPFTTAEYAMVGDAMSATIRVCQEPPCHRECAEYAMQVCPFILYPNAKRRTAGLSYEDTVDHRNEVSTVELNVQNPGEFYISIVSDFTFHEAPQIMAFDKDQVLDRQHWIGGVRQAAITEPIVPAEQVPEELKWRL